MAAINLDLDTYVRQDGKSRVRVTVYRDKLKRYPLPIHIKPSHWDAVTHRVKIGDPMHAAYNRAIAAAAQEAQTLAVDHPQWSAEDIVKAMGRKSSKGLKLHEALTTTIKERRARFAEGTIDMLEYIARATKEAIPDATLDGLTSADVYRFFDWLATRKSRGKKLEQNSLRGRMKQLRNLYRQACSHHGIGAKDLFEDVVPSEVDVEDRSFTPEEFARFEALDPPDQLALSFHAFLLAVYLGGMRWGDVYDLPPERITAQGLTLRQGKSKAVVYAQINDAARWIIDHYAGGPKVLPLGESKGAASQRVNRDLKVLAAMCGCPLEITFHWSRHAAADQLEEAGVDIRMIQLLFGHSTIQQTVDYLDKRRRKDSGRALKALGKNFRLPAKEPA